jgi:hypothetical protein
MESIKIQNKYIELLKKPDSMPDLFGEKLVRRQEPLFGSAFNFYGSRVNLARHEKLSIAKQTLFNTYKGLLAENEDNVRALDLKQKAQYTQLVTYKREAEETRVENQKLLDRVEELSDRKIIDEVEEYRETISF